MTLDPPSYSCPEHHTDLTLLVTEALADDGPPVAYDMPRRASNVLFRQRPKGPRPFAVIVNCPGANGSGVHQLTCTGTRD